MPDNLENEPPCGHRANGRLHLGLAPLVPHQLSEANSPRVQGIGCAGRDRDMHADVALSGVGEPGSWPLGPDIGGRVAEGGFDDFYRAHYESSSGSATS